MKDIWECTTCNSRWEVDQGMTPSIADDHPLGACIPAGHFGSVEGRQKCPRCTSSQTFFHPPRFDEGHCIDCGAGFAYSPSVWEHIQLEAP